MLNMAYGQYYNAAIVKPAVTSRCTQGSVGFKGAAGAGQALKGHLRGVLAEVKSSAYGDLGGTHAECLSRS